jgi:choline-glycine betaine transporter
MSPTDSRVRRRWFWLVFGLVGGVIAVACARLLQEPLIEYFRRPLSERDEIASVVGMFVGITALLVSIIGLIVSLVQARRAVPEQLVAPPTPADRAAPAAPAAPITMHINASAPLSTAQGVINGDIKNGPAPSANG